MNYVSFYYDRNFGFEKKIIFNKVIGKTFTLHKITATLLIRICYIRSSKKYKIWKFFYLIMKFYPKYSNRVMCPKHSRQENFRVYATWTNAGYLLVHLVSFLYEDWSGVSCIWRQKVSYLGASIRVYSAIIICRVKLLCHIFLAGFASSAFYIKKSCKLNGILGYH